MPSLLNSLRQGAFGYSTYFGGNGEDYAYRVALDPSNNVYITGGTLSTNLPLTSHAVQKNLPEPTAIATVVSLTPGGPRSFFPPIFR